MTTEATSVEVTHRIEARPEVIFKILARPQRHTEFDGSDMLRGAVVDEPISGVGHTFTMKMHRLGRDYFMENTVVEFEPDVRIAWEPAPGDLATAGGDPARIGVAAGYRWGFVLVPDGDDATIVTEVFDLSALSDEERRHILHEDGAWINGANPVRDSMAATLRMLERASIEGGAG